MKLFAIAFLAMMLSAGQRTDATLLPLLLHALPRLPNLLQIPSRGLNLLPVPSRGPNLLSVPSRVPNLLPVPSRGPNLLAALPRVSDALHGADDEALRCQSDQSAQFREALYEFSLSVYNAVADRVNEHFVTSPYSVWLALAALAEGAAPGAQPRLFRALGLPGAPCLRQKFYTIAMSLETPGTDVSLLRHRGIVFDESVRVDRSWSNFAKTSKLIEYVFAPMKAKPGLTEKNLRKAVGSRMKIPLRGNSVVIDSLTYRGLWTHAFEDRVATEPFYDDAGNQIGTVPMMRAKLRTRVAELPLFHAKVVELPVGDDGRYAMLVGLGMEKTGFMRRLADLQHGRVIDEVLNSLRMSPGPIEIAIPKFSMKTSYDARVVLDSLGLGDIWTNPLATTFVSDPPAMPGGLVQRVTVSIGPEGISPPAQEDLVAVLGELANAIAGHDFIANKPFMYMLLETKTRNVLFAGCYSDPNRS